MKGIALVYNTTKRFYLPDPNLKSALYVEGAETEEEEEYERFVPPSVAEFHRSDSRMSMPMSMKSQYTLPVDASIYQEYEEDRLVGL